MKTNLSIIQLLFTACIVFSCSEMKENEGFSADFLSIDTKAVKDSPVFSAYDFCNKDGFWHQFNSLEERIEATQLSESLTNNASSLDLLIMCLNNPLNILYNSYNDEYTWVNYMADNVNTFKSFEAREDAAKTLLDFYSNVRISNQQDSFCTIIDGEYSLNIYSCVFLELYITSLRNRSLFDDANRERLKQAALKVYSQKVNDPHFNYFASVSKSLFMLDLLSRQLIDNENVSHEYIRFVNSFRRVGTKSSDATDSEDNNMTFGYIMTFGNQRIEVMYKPEMPDDLIQSLNAYYCRIHPNAVYLSSSTSSYNCHSYAWYMSDRSSSSPCWINRDCFNENDSYNLEKFWTNDYYHEISYHPQAPKLYFEDVDHSIVYEPDPNYPGLDFVSKWGDGPKMRHSLFDCPYPGMANGRYFTHDRLPVVHDSTDFTPIDPGVDNPIIEEDPIRIELNISGPTSIIVGEQYYYSAPTFFNTVTGFEWHCTDSDSNSSTNIHLSNGFGLGVYLSVDAPGIYFLTTIYRLNNKVVNQSTTQITAYAQ